MTRSPAEPARAVRRVPAAVWRKIISRISGPTLRHVTAAGHSLHDYRADRDAHGAAAVTAMTAQISELHALLAGPLLTSGADQVLDALALAAEDPAAGGDHYLRADAALGPLIGRLNTFADYAQAARDLLVLRQYDLAAQRDAALANVPVPNPAGTDTGTAPATQETP